MGGLFSGPQQRQEPQRTTFSQPQYIASYQYEARLLEEKRRKQEEERRRLDIQRRQKEEDRLCLDTQIKQQHLIPISRKPLNGTVLLQPLAEYWDPMSSNSSFLKANVQKDSLEYNKVTKLFKDTTKRNFKISKIERIQNPYLLGCYLLKKNSMQHMNNKSVEELLVFHGTKQSNVESICENNFNWRLHGDSTGNRYGKGVSFSPISYYASHYSDKRNSMKVMFLVRVLVSNFTVGNGNMILPPPFYDGYNVHRYDTTGKKDGHVIVKFSDNDFYPEYLIYYTVTPNVNKNRNHYNSDIDDYY